MMRCLSFCFFFFLCCAHGAVLAESYYVWQDPESQLSFKVPDTWRMASNVNAADTITFRAPGQNQHVQCRVRVEAEPRFKIYPEGVADHIVNQELGYRFWQNWSTREFRYFKVHDVRRGKGLGNGFATMADVSYVPQALPVHKRSLIWASIYNNKLYVLDCAAEAYAFVRWYENFMFILGSVRMPKQIHELPGGDYRHFPGDPVLRVHTLPARQSSNH